MCFSAQASFTAASMLTIVGAITIYRAPKKLWGIACIPLIFALQQSLEGVIWLTFDKGNVSHLLHQSAVYGFIAIAGIVWPIWAPGILYSLETHPTVKRVLFGALIGGLVVSTWCVVGYVLMGRDVQIVNHHLSYPYRSSSYGSLTASHILFIDQIMMFLYMIVTVGAPLMSSLKSVWILGVLVGFGWVVAVIFYYLSFGSLWCYFAAIASLVIYYVVRANNSSKN